MDKRVNTVYRLVMSWDDGTEMELKFQTYDEARNFMAGLSLEDKLNMTFKIYGE